MSTRRAALRALMEVTEKGAYANLALKACADGLCERDAAWVSAAVYTTLDHLLYIDHVLGAFTKGKLQPAIRGVLRLGAAQVLFMHTPQNAACNESVKLAKEIGKGALSGYVNGVMRALCRAAEEDALPPLPEDTLQRLCVQYSYPEFLVSQYLEAYGEAFTEKMLSYGQRGITLRAQPPYTEEALAAWLEESRIAYHRGGLVPRAFCLEKGLAAARQPLFEKGCITVQSESAMLVCELLAPKKGWRVLDACAAPGGKTAYLSALMQGTGEILCWELHPHRAAITEKTLERLHVQNARVEVQDARVPVPALNAQMDAVLVDAPCSGLGVPGKPDVRYAKNDAIIRELAALQRDILDACCAYVKPGGVLVYATCTISRAENQAQVERFLAAHGEFRPVSLADGLPGAGLGGEAGMLQLFPHIHHTEGFFMAKMERIR